MLCKDFLKILATKCEQAGFCLPRASISSVKCSGGATSGGPFHPANARVPASVMKRAAFVFLRKRGTEITGLGSERGECHVAVFCGGGPLLQKCHLPTPPYGVLAEYNKVFVRALGCWRQCRQASCHCRMYLPYVCVGAGLRRWLLFWLFLEQAVRMRRTDSGQIVEIRHFNFEKV